MTFHAITWSGTISSKWLTLQPIRIGDVPSGIGTPDQYILLEFDGQPALRIDAYTSSMECFAFQDAILWNELLVIGWGESVYTINVASGGVTKQRLSMYFGHIYFNHEYLLVASGEQLLRLDREGKLQWTSDVLGIDGVIVLDVSHGIISGEGKWDPPGGWRPFRIYLDSGGSANE